MLKRYKDFLFKAKHIQAEIDLCAYIDAIENSARPFAIPDSDNFDTITHSAFDGITYLEIPERITEIGGCAFAKNRDLETIIIRGRARLGQDCFNGSAISKIKMDYVWQIGAFCFWHANNLTSLSMPNVLRANTRAIGRCANLQYLSAQNLTDFGKFIYDCPELTYINLGTNSPDFTNKFDIATIQKCPKIKNINCGANFESGTEHILRENMAPKITISQIYNNPYTDTTKLAKLDAENPVAKQDPASINSQPNKKQYEFEHKGWRIVCTSKKTWIELYKIADAKGQLPAGNLETEMSQFPDIVHVGLPDYIKKIPPFAFAQCYDMRSIKGEGKIEICDHAFYCNNKMQSIQFPNARIAGPDAFNGAGEKNCWFDMDNLRQAYSRAFWQTGADKLCFPKLKLAQQNAIEENEHLRYLNTGKATLQFLSVCSNPQLNDIISTGRKNEFAFFHNFQR